MSIAVLGIYLFLFLRLGAGRLIVDRDGVEVRGLTATRRIAWTEVQRYSFVSVDPNARGGYGQAGLAGVLVIAAVRALSKAPANRTFKAGRLVLRGQGAPLKISPRYRDVDQALERIFAELHPRLQASTQFGDLSFDGGTLHHVAKGALSLSELDKVVVSPAGTITVRKIGKRFAWATVAMARIDNSLLLYERLADRGVVIEMSKAMFLPLPTLGLLTRVAAVRAGLPQARIQKS
jgi:hypothetical protein